MLTQPRYTVLSLELHMFFARIMKEHAFFLMAGFTPANAAFNREAEGFKRQFEEILAASVRLGNGVIQPKTVASHEFVTDYTLGTEEKSQKFTGIPLSKNITAAQSKLYGTETPKVSPELYRQVKSINVTAQRAVGGIIEFKKRVLDAVLSCNAFTVNYPLLIKHILHEAEMYRSLLQDLEKGQDIEEADSRQTELFWDQIMMEHALFIRGLLDPSENALIAAANNFAREYSELIGDTKSAAELMLGSITAATLDETEQLRDFKSAATAGIAECKIQSVILPLLADHVLREANHYIRVLQDFS